MGNIAPHLLRFQAGGAVTLVFLPMPLYVSRGPQALYGLPRMVSIPSGAANTAKDSHSVLHGSLAAFLCGGGIVGLHWLFLRGRFCLLTGLCFLGLLWGWRGRLLQHSLAGTGHCLDLLCDVMGHQNGDLRSMSSGDFSKAPASIGGHSVSRRRAGELNLRTWFGAQVIHISAQWNNNYYRWMDCSSPRSKEGGMEWRTGSKTKGTRKSINCWDKAMPVDVKITEGENRRLMK